MAEWNYSITDVGRSALTTLHAYQGSTSLECQTYDGAGFKAARWGNSAAFPSLTSGALYLRGYYRLSADTVHADHIAIMVASNLSPPYPSTHVVLLPDEVVLGVNGAVFRGPMPRDRWVCIELDISIATAGFVELRVDGAPVVTTPATDTVVANGYTSIDVGVYYATPAQGRAVGRRGGRRHRPQWLQLSRTSRLAPRARGSPKMPARPVGPGPLGPRRKLTERTRATRARAREAQSFLPTSLNVELDA